MLIGLAGHAGVGKDTIGQILVTRLGFRRVAFADKVKQLALMLDPGVTINKTTRPENFSLATLFIESGFNWDEIKQHSEVRVVLQTLGQASRDLLGDRVWINAANLDSHLEQDIVVTDVRYANEVQEIQNLGGEVWLVQRDGVSPVNQHPSETSIAPSMANRLITNKGSYSQLDLAVRKALKAALEPTSYYW